MTTPPKNTSAPLRPRAIRASRTTTLAALACVAAFASPVVGASAAGTWTSRVAAPVNDIVVTAMTVAPNGTIYAAGRVVTPSSEPFASPPVNPVAATFLVSTDGGLSWNRRDSARNVSMLIAPWSNHGTLPPDFTTLGLTVDPAHPRVLYAAGCASTDTGCGIGNKPGQQHTLLVSTTAGATWSEAVRLTIGVGAGGRLSIGGNIGVNAGLIQSVSRGGSIAGLSALVAHGRVYGCLRGIGLIYSANAGRSWVYSSQPQSAMRGCELVADPTNPRTIYALNNAAALYRTSTAGASWTQQAGLAFAIGGRTHATGLSIIGQTLWVTRPDGLYMSANGGASFVRRIPAAAGTSLVDAVHGAGGWVVAAAGTSRPGATGLYRSGDGGPLTQVAGTLTKGPAGYGALDIVAYNGYGRRMWNSHAARAVFTSGPEGGIYRWSVGV